LLYSSILRLLLIGTFAALGILVLLLIGHAATGSDLLLRPAEAFGVALGLLGVSSLVLGVAYAWSAYPRHRRAVLFLVLITLGTLLAHVYVMGSPAAGTPATLVGAAGVELQDNQIQVQSTFHNQSLSVIVRSIGGNAIGDLELSAPGATLISGGFSPQPTFAAPLGTGSSTGGTWDVAGNVSQIELSYQYLTCYDAGAQHYGCIMDESFYVPEAMGLLAGQQCSDSFADGYHCHMEHPFLAPALVAAGMAVFGEYSTAAWRTFPVLLGTFSIPIVFGIAWKLSNDKRLAYLSALFVALDVMFFSQSSAALLDIPEIFFGLLAMLAYVWEIRFWKLDKYIITGILLGLAGLAKETAVFIALGLLTYIFFFEETKWRKKLFSVGKVAVVVILVFAIGLQVYDSTMVSPNGLAAGIANSCPGQTAFSSYPNFIDHVRYILCYGSTLIAHTLLCQSSPTSASGYWCKYPTTPGNYAPILPTDWLVYYTPVAYYSTSVTVCPNSVNGVCVSGQYSYVQLAYYGVTNFLVTWTIFIAVPLLAYVLYKGYRKPSQGLEAFGFAQPESGPTLSSEVKYAGFVLTYFLWNYIPYLFLLVAGRVTYPFYMVPAIPAIAMGAAYFATRKWFPRWLLYIYIAAVFVFFFVFFPSKAFLPDWLRVIIGH
jgi:4-amino-4-deoxy-L-arabinose transferase-like glycosyltransferase